MRLWCFISQKEYLKEPTAEFKAIEARQSEFASAQRAYKQEFVKKLDAFLAAETDEDAVTTLNAMSRTVIQRGGLPESVRINDLLKTCRRKKGAMKDSGKWGTPVQIAYEARTFIHNSRQECAVVVCATYFVVSKPCQRQCGRGVCFRTSTGVREKCGPREEVNSATTEGEEWTPITEKNELLTTTEKRRQWKDSHIRPIMRVSHFTAVVVFPCRYAPPLHSSPSIHYRRRENFQLTEPLRMKTKKPCSFFLISRHNSHSSTTGVRRNLT